MGTIWDKILSARMARKVELLKITNEWAALDTGISVRFINVTEVPKSIVKKHRLYLECVFNNGLLTVHNHDYIEGWYILDGEIEDTLTGEIMKAGDFRIWDVFDLHEPKAKYCHLIVTVD